MVDIIRLFETPTFSGLFNIVGWASMLLVYTVYKFVKSFNNLRYEKARQLRLMNDALEKRQNSDIPEPNEVIKKINEPKKNVLKKTIEEGLGIK